MIVHNKLKQQRATMRHLALLIQPILSTYPHTTDASLTSHPLIGAYYYTHLSFGSIRLHSVPVAFKTSKKRVNQSPLNITSITATPIVSEAKSIHL